MLRNIFELENRLPIRLISPNLAESWIVENSFTLNNDNDSGFLYLNEKDLLLQSKSRPLYLTEEPEKIPSHYLARKTLLERNQPPWWEMKQSLEPRSYYQVVHNRQIKWIYTKNGHDYFTQGIFA